MCSTWDVQPRPQTRPFESRLDALGKVHVLVQQHDACGCGYTLAWCVWMRKHASLVVGMWRVVRGVWRVACGVWCLVFGASCVVRGVWRVACGAWCLACGVWCVVLVTHLVCAANRHVVRHS